MARRQGWHGERVRSWRRALATATTVLALVVLPGCGDSPDERAQAIGYSLEQVEGVSRVETSTPSGMFTREVHATAHITGPIRRETYERVASAVREYRTQERTGAFGSPAEVWVEGSIGRVPVPTDDAAADLVAAWVEELADVSDPVTGYEIDGTTRYHIALTTDDPLAAARRYATGDGALASDPDIPATFTAARPGPDARTGDGVESIEVPLGDPDTVAQLDALRRSSEVAGRGEPALLRLFNETVTVAVEGQKPAELVSLHADVAELACDHLGVSTRSGAFSVEGCGDLTGARELVASLKGFDLISFEADTNPDAVQVVGVREVDDLLAVTELDLEDRLYLVKAGSSRTGLVSVTGTTADMRALAPVAAAAAGDGREVTAARASDDGEVDVTITGEIPDPAATFRAMREASWSGELTFGIRTPEPRRSAVRWTSTVDGPAQRVGPIRGDADERTMGEATKALVAAWDASVV